MRLRYLQMPRCAAMNDVAVVFRQEDLVSRMLELPRKGTLNFIVGVNGSGKSSLLRTIYEAFTALRGNRFPKHPMALAWDTRQSQEIRTALLLVPGGKDEPHFATVPQVSAILDESAWRQIMTLQDAPDVLRGQDVLGAMLQAYLPRRLIAYTSGATELWAQLEHPDFHPDESATEEDYEADAERTPGWSLKREWDEEQPLRITNMLNSVAGRSSARSFLEDDFPPDVAAHLMQQIQPLADLADKIAANLMPRESRLEQTYFRVETKQLRYAAVVLALVQAAKELRGCHAHEAQETLRKRFLESLTQGIRSKDARALLNRIDWFWPTHLSLIYHDAEDRVSPRQHRELLSLVALAEEVVQQPRGRMRLIIPLGPRAKIDLKSAFKAVLGTLPEWAKNTAGRVNDVKTGAEAVLRVLSEDKELDSTPLDAFTRLRDWEKTGLLEEITLTVRRLQRPSEESDRDDDHIITFDQMSDGEQALLGRMGLLYLLRGQDGSLLLLDEPETHFNDAWKREMVEMIDAGLLDSTHASVLVATHTSIALTDAFAAEVTVLDKGVARSVSGGLFGTDPSEVTMSLFSADGTTGTRSARILDDLLKTEWKGREAELEAVLKVLGSSFHRAELRAILKQLQASSNGPA